jgi:hypothetical protein
MVKDSTYVVPRLVSGMQYSTHTILFQIYSVVGEFYTSYKYRKTEGTPLGVSSKGGIPFIEGRFDLTKEKGYWRFEYLGSSCRVFTIISSAF